MSPSPNMTGVKVSPKASKIKALAVTKTGKLSFIPRNHVKVEGEN